MTNLFDGQLIDCLTCYDSCMGYYVYGYYKRCDGIWSIQSRLGIIQAQISVAISNHLLTPHVVQQSIITYFMTIPS
jgi:hypothetical protein